MQRRKDRAGAIQYARTFALWAAGLSLFLLLFSCSRTTKRKPPDISMEESIHFEYAVYLLPTTASLTQDATTLLRQSLPKYPGLIVVDELPKTPQAMFVYAHVNKNVKKSYAPPRVESLRRFGRGLTEDQAKALQQSTSALLLDFAHPRKDVWAALRTASGLVEEIARKSGGLVWDEETREVFSPDAWHQKRLASWTNEIPDVSTQTVIHIYPNGEYARAITLGMSKIGLPDVVVEESSWSSDNQVGNLINIFSQALAETQRPLISSNFRLDLHAIKNVRLRENHVKSLKPNAAGVACLSLAEGKWEEGDPKNRLVRLASDEYPGNDSHAQQEAMLSSFFGWEDSMVKVHDNEELLVASTKAKGELPELRKAFNAGLEPGEFIEVKAPFRAENGATEWMWVEVTSWKGDRIKGVLNNDPEEVANLRAGQIVEVREGDVFDYLHNYADKHTEGNTTGEIIRKMSEGEVKNPSTPSAVPACATK